MELVPHPNGAIPASQGDISGKSDAGHLDFGLVRRRGLPHGQKGARNRLLYPAKSIFERFRLFEVVLDFIAPEDPTLR